MSEPGRIHGMAVTARSGMANPGDPRLGLAGRGQAVATCQEVSRYGEARSGLAV